MEPLEKFLFHCYAFGQIAGLIYVAAFEGGDIVGEQLQGDDAGQGGEDVAAEGQVDDVVGKFVGAFIPLVTDEQYIGPAGLV